mmetsp:Transcript_127936/g.409890  ORF Transcript_127936/g.409890 Transcript_127936/m.409890 type:complete len:112 (+) Transcript_127936:552-887(+)
MTRGWNLPSNFPGHQQQRGSVDLQQHAARAEEVSTCPGRVILFAVRRSAMLHRRAWHRIFEGDRQDVESRQATCAARLEAGFGSPSKPMRRLVAPQKRSLSPCPRLVAAAL